MKRALKIIGIVLAVLIVALIALPFTLNVNSFRPKLESELSSALGRQVKVGNLDLSILSGGIAAENISIADDPAFSTDPFIRAKSLKVGVELMPLIFSKTLRITDLTLDEPQVVLLRSTSGTWNFSSLGGGSKSTSQGTSNPNLSVAKLKVSNGSVSIGNAGSNKKLHTYDKVNITVKNFSFASQFPFTLSAGLPGGGDLNLDGTAGPISPTDASLTPLEAKIDVKRLDLAASGFVEPGSGISGVTDFDGTLKSDGSVLHSNGTVNADRLKLVPKGAPAGRPVQVKYAVEHDLQKQSGQLSQGNVVMGKALAKLGGTYRMQGDSTFVNMKLSGQSMPVNDLQVMLPAVGITLPPGSSLNGGTLSTTLGISGSTDKLVITGPIRLSDTRLAGFNLGSKLAAISKLSGSTQTGTDTSIQNLSTDLHFSPSGIQTQNINLTVPALGVLTGSGTISPGGEMDYKMNANLAGAAVTGLTQMAGLGAKGARLPFFVRGTTSNPTFVPDVQGIVNSQIQNQLQKGLQDNGKSGGIFGKIGGLFGRKKQEKK